MRPHVLLLALAAASCASTGRAPGGADGGPPDMTMIFEPGPGDSFPTGAISFFKLMTCPDGWDSLPAAANRFVVPTVGADKSGVTAGEPLKSGEDREHLHPVAATATLREVSYAGIAGEANHGLAQAAPVKVMTTSGKASTNLPYVQLRVCKKSAPPKWFPTPIPPGTLLFFDAQSCPAGWSQAKATQGRFLVGLPSRGAPGASFGGPPLAAKEDRVHAHTVQGAFSTNAQGIALAAGCCAGGYAQNGAYTLQSATDINPAGLPYIEYLQCRKD